MAETARRNYYLDRLNPTVRQHGRALVGLVGAIAARGAPMGRDELLARAFRLLRETAAFDKPGRRDAVAFVDDLIHDGVLQENAARNGYEVPIPSMRSWILEDFARDRGYDDRPPPRRPAEAPED